MYRCFIEMQTSLTDAKVPLSSSNGKARNNLFLEIVMIILFAISFSTAKDLIDSTKAKKYATVMYLIKGEILNRQDEAEFIKTENSVALDTNATKLYIGTKLNTDNMSVADNLQSILINEVNATEYNLYYNPDYAEGMYNEVKEYWYILTRDDLNKVGIDTDFANNDDKVFIINYMTTEIIYTPGVEIQIQDPVTLQEVDKKVYTLRTFESL